MGRIPRGRNARREYLVQHSTTYGDWPFLRDEQGRWVCKKTGKLAKVQSLESWLANKANKPDALERGE